MGMPTKYILRYFSCQDVLTRRKMISDVAIYSVPQIISDVITFMVGGFHTSGYFMTWLFWYLAEHPAVQERLVEEIEEIVGGECGEKLKEYALSPTTLVKQGATEVTGGGDYPVIMSPGMVN